MTTKLEDDKLESGETIHVEKDVHVEEEALTTVSAWQSAKENPRVILFSLCACIGSILWGYDIGKHERPQCFSNLSLIYQTGISTITMALPAFKLVFGYEYEGVLLLSAVWNSLWTAMTFLGMLIGRTSWPEG